jgi:hypothetical protein
MGTADTSIRRTHLDQAYRTYSARRTSQYFQPENAMVCYKRWKVLGQLGRNEEARKNANDALKLFRTIQPNDMRPLDILTDTDFDKSIMFWSR